MHSLEVGPVYPSHPESLQKSISGWPERIGACAPARVCAFAPSLAQAAPL